jgi:hypothetical protein
MERGEERVEGGKPWIWAARGRSHYEYAYRGRRRISGNHLVTNETNQEKTRNIPYNCLDERKSLEMHNLPELRRWLSNYHIRSKSLHENIYCTYITYGTEGT